MVQIGVFVEFVFNIGVYGLYYCYWIGICVGDVENFVVD